MLEDAWQGGCFSFNNSTLYFSRSQEGITQMPTPSLRFHHRMTQWLLLKSCLRWYTSRNDLNWVIEALNNIEPLFHQVQCEAWKRRFFRRDCCAENLGHHVQIQCCLKVTWRIYWAVAWVGVQRTTEKVKEASIVQTGHTKLGSRLSAVSNQICNPPQPQPLVPLDSIRGIYPYDVIFLFPKRA